MAALSVQMFGRFSVCRDGRELERLDSTKAQELLCYLLLHRERPHAREPLAGKLWGDSSASQAKKHLRQSLWQLQSILEPEGGPAGARLMEAGQEWVRVNPEVDLWVDVIAFEEAFSTVQGIGGAALGIKEAAMLRATVEIYGGDLLEGWYQDWCLYERTRLQDMYLDMLDKLIGYSEAHEEYEAGIEFGRRILRLDQARERTHRRLMRLHYLAGDRAMALRQYQRCAMDLGKALGVNPSRRTQALYERIRDDGDVASDAPEARSPAPIDMPLPEVLRDLRQLQMTLAQLQRRVERNIQSIDRALDARN